MNIKLSTFTPNRLKALLVVLAASSGLSSVYANADEVNFEGERVEWVVPFKEGGGSDTWARFFGPRFSQHLNGKPVVVVKNIPGGGSTKGANRFERRAKPNGLNVFSTSASTQIPYLLGDSRVKYNVKRWNVIMATPTGAVVYVRPELGIKSAAELTKLQGQKLKFGSQRAASMDLVGLLAFDMLDLDIHAIFGMKGRGSARLSFERGEVDIDFQTTSAYLKKVQPLVDEGKAIPLMSFGVLNKDGVIVRDPTFPDLPHVGEVYEMIHGEKPTGVEYNVWKTFFIAGFAAQKGLFLPQGTPDDVIESWRSAAQRVIDQDNFKEESELVLGEYPQLIHEDAVNTLSSALTISETDKEWVRQYLNDNYNTRF
ncbi:tricarboxylate transporter [Pseudoalteromonas sp. FUC4]|uniref:Bug family tripartite tricarboxylate transporter substrate binding protein n=1 Tax=Pseudoalteromonas sp. FUC4 TaxID=2511201 RepID=UPI0011F3B956|nr:tripartite tricarboxylate transporter substrate-binding protein [Pseudoalteromonas sp. FUC4]KAA1155592.1 tricarboxylate transporter [Pseudoalteromonas sp. FUC4]